MANNFYRAALEKVLTDEHIKNMANNPKYSFVALWRWVNGNLDDIRAAFTLAAEEEERRIAANESVICVCANNHAWVTCKIALNPELGPGWVPGVKYCPKCERMYLRCLGYPKGQ